jgi:hypothetical protein
LAVFDRIPRTGGVLQLSNESIVRCDVPDTRGRNRQHRADAAELETSWLDIQRYLIALDMHTNRVFGPKAADTATYIKSSGDPVLMTSRIGTGSGS